MRDRADAAEKEWNDTQASDVRLAQDAEDTAYRRAMAFLNAGVMPTDNMLRAAGIDKETARAMRAAALRKLGQ